MDKPKKQSNNLTREELLKKYSSSFDMVNNAIAVARSLMADDNYDYNVNGKPKSILKHTLDDLGAQVFEEKVVE